MTNEHLESLKRLALAIADAIPPEMLDEVRRERAALCELDHPAEPETSEPSFVGDKGVALITTQWASPIMRKLAREVQAWRALADGYWVSQLSSRDHAASASLAVTSRIAAIRRRSKGES